MELTSNNTTKATHNPTSSLPTTIARLCTTQGNQVATQISTTAMARVLNTSSNLVMTIQTFRVTTEEAVEVKELLEVGAIRTSVVEDTTNQTITNSSFAVDVTHASIRAITRNTRRTVIKVVTQEELLAVAAVALLEAASCTEAIVAGVITTNTTVAECASITNSRTQ